MVLSQNFWQAEAVSQVAFRMAFDLDALGRTLYNWILIATEHLRNCKALEWLV